MFTKILNDNEVNKFNELTGMKVMKVFISKNKKYYYACCLRLKAERFMHII